MAPALLPLLAAPFVYISGFTSSGVASGSLAATMQASLGGNIAAGSPFAIAQSIGATTGIGVMAASGLTYVVLVGGTMALVYYGPEIVDKAPDVAQVVFQDAQGVWKQGSVIASDKFSKIGDLIKDGHFGKTLTDDDKDVIGHASGEIDKFLQSSSMHEAVEAITKASQNGSNDAIRKQPEVQDAIEHLVTGLQDVGHQTEDAVKDSSADAEIKNIPKEASDEAKKIFSGCW